MYNDLGIRQVKSPDHWNAMKDIDRNPGRIATNRDCTIDSQIHVTVLNR